MGNKAPAEFPRIHGKYRKAPVESKPEEHGRREVPAQPGVTYVLLWTGRKSCVLEISDTGKYGLVNAIPKDATLAHDNFLDHECFNRNGVIPREVCAFITLALKIQETREPKKNPNQKHGRCPCEACQAQQKAP
jgi:hypothetical protein